MVQINQDERGVGALPAFVAQSWRSPEMPALLPATGAKLDYRFFRIDEIIEEKSMVNRQAMANVISCMNNAKSSMVYMVRGDKHGVKFHIGVAGASDGAADTGSLLSLSYAGNFLGANIEARDNGLPEIAHDLSDMRHMGIVTGIPSFNKEDSGEPTEFQGVERLVNSLAGEPWSLIVVAQPGSTEEVLRIIEQIYDYATSLSAHTKVSVQSSSNLSLQTSLTTGTSSTHTHGDNSARTTGYNDTRGKNQQAGGSDSRGSSTSTKTYSDSTNESRTTNHGNTTGQSSSLSTGDSSSSSRAETEGSGVSHTRESTSKQLEELARHLSDTQLPRFRQGHSKGMFRTAIYLCANSPGVFQRLSHGVLSIFQGDQASMTPLRVHKLESPPFNNLGDVLRIHATPNTGFGAPATLVHSLAVDTQSATLQGATWLNSEELSLLMGFPSKELPGIRIRKSVAFAVNVPAPTPNASICLGNVVQHGRQLETNPVHLNVDTLDKHIFITGVTGAGKTTTCMKILLESGLPFMVIEPAKTEYRAMHGLRADISYYALGREDLTPFRLNPFELVSEQELLASHIDILKNTLAAVYPMEAAMPYIVEEAIIQAYRRKGWDIHGNVNYLIDAPFAVGSGAWPNFSDVIDELTGVIKSKNMGKEFEDKYLGSLVARLSNLTLGTKGRMLNCRQSLDFDRMLDQRVVIELDEIKDESDKALFMGLIIGRMAECIKQRHAAQTSDRFRHLTLIEEAHRLLARPAPGDGGGKKLGVEMFCNLLAEVRKYGEGLIIADQIPNKLVPDVIKNTNLKIVHRLFAADDRSAIGDAMCLNDEQKDHLPLLRTGEAVIYSGGWHGAVLVAVTKNTDTGAKVLDTAVLRARTASQMAAYRDRLFPNLACHATFPSGLDFMDFQADAGLLLGLLGHFLAIHYVHGPKESRSDSVRQMAAITARLQAKTRLFTDAWLQRLPDQQLAQATAAHFADEHQLAPTDPVHARILPLFLWLLAPQGPVVSELANLVDAVKTVRELANAHAPAVKQ
jgi:hypothetical protein